MVAPILVPAKDALRRPIMNIHQIQEARENSGIESWGAGYYGVDDQGNVICYPDADDKNFVSLPEIMEEAKKLGISTPLIIRFPQAIRRQLRRMHQAFANSVKEYNYQGRHLGVFPFKVNQRREFIDAIISYGREVDWGLEVGSKTEFMAALSYPMSKESLLICNGFKDSEFIQIAFTAASLGRKVVCVVEGPDELEMIVQQSKVPTEGVTHHPEVGLRVRLSSKGSGKWEKSSGESSKFGLTTVELLHALHLLEKAGMQKQLSMLHFHIGSQITAIKRFKNALKEAAIVYAKVIKMGFSPKYLNIGGGVGVDYDGSRTTATSSANYNLQEFANDAVYVISEVCKAEGVKMPDIVTESGRVIAAYHSVVVTDIREIQGEETLDTIEGFDIEKEVINAQRATRELKYILDNVSRKNYAEYYHDAVEFNEELQTLFNLGYIPLKERAAAEHMYHLICRRALYFSSFEKGDGDEFESLQRLKVSKYLANFSIFQSIPDSWSIDQLFPVMPLSRHDEKPTLKGTIVDITCDSDGCLERFIDSTDQKNFLDLHTMSNAPYYLGFFLTGAYQESLANEHNLFGAIHEIEVVFNEQGDWKISKVTEGDPIHELLTSRNYDMSEMIESYREQISEAQASHDISATDGPVIFERLKGYLSSYPYLKRD